MKKKTKIILAVLILLLLIPIPMTGIKDGGTKTFTSLTYKIVSWNRLVDAGNIYSATEFYIFPFNFLSLDALWNSKTDRFTPKATDKLCSVDHSPAETDQTVNDPYLGGWCGNTQATIIVDGEEYTFMLGDSITLNALYENHSFKDKICECDSGIEIKTEMGNYTVNLEKNFVRSDKGQGQLTEKQVKEIKDIIERQTAS